MDSQHFWQRRPSCFQASSPSSRRLATGYTSLSDRVTSSASPDRSMREQRSGHRRPCPSRASSPWGCAADHGLRPQRGQYLVAAVVGARGGGADGDVVVFRSTDGSSTWAAPVVINDVPGAAREGLHAMAASPDGLVVIAWLDLREPGTRINAAVSRDHGATWAPDALVYSSPSGSVCECCHPSVAIDDGGSIAIMFRNNVDGNRDMFVARSSDGVRSPPRRSSVRVPGR